MAAAFGMRNPRCASRPNLRLLLASSSVAAILIGGGTPAAFAACVNGGGGYDNPSPTTIAGICVANTSFSGNITNEGTISPSGIAFDQAERRQRIEQRQSRRRQLAAGLLEPRQSFRSRAA
jgi:hypothetical protein